MDTPKKTSSTQGCPPSDLNKRAKWVVDQVTETMGEESKARQEAARLLGSVGGKKGGKARAEKLSPERRKEIAKKAAKVRWDSSLDG